MIMGSPVDIESRNFIPRYGTRDAGRAIPRAMISTRPVLPFPESLHASRPVRHLSRRPDAAVDRVCRAQAPRSRELRRRGAQDADLLRSAGLELGRSQVAARACAEVDRRV